MQRTVMFGFLLLALCPASSGDQEALLIGPPQSSKAVAALVKHDQAVDRAQREHEKNRLPAQRECLRELEASLRLAMKNEDLDEAKRIEAAKKWVQTHADDSESVTSPTTGRAVAALRKYRHALRRLEEGLQAAQHRARDECLADLDQALTRAMRNEDLDEAKRIEAVQKRLRGTVNDDRPITNPSSAQATSALKACERAESRADDAYAKVRRRAQQQCIEELDEALRLAMRSQDLDEAKRIEGAKKHLVSEAPTETPVDEPTSARAAAALKKHADALSKASAARRNALVTAKQECIRQLDVALRLAMRQEDLEEAKRISAVRDRIQDELDDLTAKWVFISTLQEEEAKAGFGGFRKDGLCGTGIVPITVNGQASPHGLSMHALDNSRAYVRYRLDGEYVKIRGGAALNDTSPGSRHPIVFVIVGDGKVLWGSPPVSKSRKPVFFNVAIRNVRTLELIVQCDGSSHGAHAVWFEPALGRR